MTALSDASDAVVKSLMFDVVLKLVIQKLVTRFAFLGWWWINPVFVFVMEKVATQIYEELARLVAFKLIDVELGAKKDAYEKATEELKNAIEKEDADAIAKAKEEYKAKLRALVKRS